MATEVVMPQMGESIAEGTITKWLVQPGDKVERDQPLFEISTDKVDAEIPSPIAGTLIEIKAQEGETVPVDAVVAMIGEEGESTGASGDAGDEKEAESADPPAAEEVSGADAGEGSEASGAADDASGAEDDSDDDKRPGGRRFASPLVRKIAKEEGVDLADVEGTGVKGRVTKADIMAYLEGGGKAASEKDQPTAPTPGQPAPPPASKPSSGFSVPPYGPNEPVEIEPMSKIRQITAAHMRYSKDTSAHVTTVFHFDFTRVDRIRRAAKAGFLKANGTKLTYMPFIFKAVTTALKKHKQINAAIDGTNIVYKKRINLGMAVALDRGLIVPVIKDADELNLVGLAKTANDLADRARTKKLKPDEAAGGTFTITNPGVFGSLFGTPIINQPQVAIMGIGAIEKRPVVRQDADGADTLAIRTMSYFNITYDHRLVDGADADHFMNDVKKVIEEDPWSELDAYI
ncbi:MAG: 2-oxoglutarate dehydrogenase, E2 component, dihydrolipoamide succinyltransferase [Acidobacteriota bacterium]